MVSNGDFVIFYTHLHQFSSHLRRFFSPRFNWFFIVDFWNDWFCYCRAQCLPIGKKDPVERILCQGW